MDDSLTRIVVDLNVRVEGNRTYASLRDCSGPVCIGQPVVLLADEMDLVGSGSVFSIDFDKRLVYLNVDWWSFTDLADGVG